MTTKTAKGAHATGTQVQSNQILQPKQYKLDIWVHGKKNVQSTKFKQAMSEKLCQLKIWSKWEQKGQHETEQTK